MAKARSIPSRGNWLRRDSPEAEADRAELGRLLTAHELAALGSYYWEGWARDAQLPPEQLWRTWLICAGRGFGKTRAGAEWVRDIARNDSDARIALVGASLTEVRNVMVEGDSGVLAAAPGALAPLFEPSLRKLTWENGATAWLYSANEPEVLRGPQHSHAGRTGAEGILRERSAGADRRAPSPDGGGAGRHSARLPSDRGVLDRRCRRIGRMGESRRPSGELGRHAMELLCPGGRHACLRPFGGGTPGLSRRMEPARSARAAGRWFGNRQRSAYGNRGDRRPACNTCDNPANLTGTRCAPHRSPDTEGVRSPELILKAREKRHYCNSSRPLFACHLKG